MVQNFTNSQILVDIRPGTATIETINVRHDDSSGAGNNLVRVRDRPPGDDQALKTNRRAPPVRATAYPMWRARCGATRLLSSGIRTRGPKCQDALKAIGAKTRRAATELTAAIKLAQARGDFRRPAQAIPSDDEGTLKLRPEEITSILKTGSSTTTSRTEPRRGRDRLHG